MVLKKYLIVLSAIALGCVSRHQAVKAPSADPVAIAAVLGTVDSLEVQAFPDSVLTGIKEVLSEHNLPPELVSNASYLDEYKSKRTTAHRLTYLSEHSNGAKLLMLVETQAAYYSQMNGRYRWTVEVSATISPSNDLTQAFTASFNVPVFLDHYHEQEIAALEAASPVIKRRLGTLLDAWIGGLE